MARVKIPENETPEEMKERTSIETISNASNRNEKMSWNRKMDNMVKLIAKLEPIEERIITLINEEKNPIIDKIQDLRTVMVKECIHPKDYIIAKDNHFVCKFCERKIQVNV